MCNQRCGCTRFNNNCDWANNRRCGNEELWEAEELIFDMNCNRCRENRCVRQFEHCLREAEEHRCGCGCRCNCNCNRCF